MTVEISDELWQSFLNGPSLASFSFISSFQTNFTILQQIYVKKCQSSMRC